MASVALELVVLVMRVAADAAADGGVVATAAARLGSVWPVIQRRIAIWRARSTSWSLNPELAD